MGQRSKPVRKPKCGDLDLFQNGGFLRGCMQTKVNVKIWGVANHLKPFQIFETHTKQSSSVAQTVVFQIIQSVHFNFY